MLNKFDIILLMNIKFINDRFYNSKKKTDLRRIFQIEN